MNVAGISNYPTNTIKKDNPGIIKKFFAGVAGGIAANTITGVVAAPVFLLLSKGITKINRSVSKDSIQILNKAGDKILQDSGLVKKGVQILRELPEDMKFQMDMLNNILSSVKLPKNIKKAIKISSLPYRLKLGKTSAFLSIPNKIVATNKIPLAQFHELGHAMNYNLGKVGNFIQSCRPNMIPARFLKGQKIPLITKLLVAATPIIGLVSIFKNKKAKGEKPQGIFDKTTTFIKNNVGKLSALTFAPIILEEGLASFKGEKAVKNLINPELFKKVKFTNRLGLATYILAATATGMTTIMASKIRDRIAQPNLNKNS